MSLSKIFSGLESIRFKKPRAFHEEADLASAVDIVCDMCLPGKENQIRMILSVGFGEWGRDKFVQMLSAKLGKQLALHAVDDFFVKDGHYKFDARNLKWAHQWCQARVRNSLMDRSKVVFVANTNAYLDHINVYNQFKEDFLMVQFIPETMEFAIKMGENNARNIPAHAYKKAYCDIMRYLEIHPETVPRLAGLIKVKQTDVPTSVPKIVPTEQASTVEKEATSCECKCGTVQWKKKSV